MTDEQTKNIVVVDDEKYICNIIDEALGEYGNFKVIKFSDPAQALEYISDNGVDLVLTDLVMGEFSGVQILERTLAEHPDAVVVLMTGYPTVKTAISVLKKGGYDYLTKPFKLENLKATIQRGLESQAIKRENVALRSQLELMKVAREYAQGMKLRPLLELVVNSAVQVLPAQAASILLRNRKTDSFYLVNMAGDTAEEAIPKFLLGDNEKFREVLNNRRPLTGQQEIDIEGKTFKRSLLSYPLISHGEVIGLLNLVYTDRYSFISPGQKRMLSLLVSTAASAVEANFLNRDLRKSYFQTIKALANAIEARDRYTAGHTDRVYRFAKVIARKMGWNMTRLAQLKTGCLLHDIGKIGVPDAILNKPEFLTDYERNIMMKHPEMGARILKSIPFLEEIIPYILYHHERFDGQGYPFGLKGKDIPVEGRLLAVVDTFDAITSDRPYRPGRPPEAALEELAIHSGTQFDPDIVKIFMKVYREGKIHDEGQRGVGGYKMRILIPSGS